MPFLLLGNKIMVLQQRKEGFDHHGGSTDDRADGEATGDRASRPQQRAQMRSISREGGSWLRTLAFLPRPRPK
jgi:hypothetical protein